RRATAGNLAFPYSPSDFHAGAVYEFSVYHLLQVEDGTALFPVEVVQL
ncbi:MAG: 3-methylaspartate ammonia-lyase, partial [Oscillospiraceae bacterium]|nr:3-methylaspartate ammonia-lyase [Oscillospiraceae bacterium]